MSAGAERGSGSACRNWRLISAAIVTAAVLVFVAANTHLVYVAFASRPDCVPHAKEAGGTTYRAAQSAC